MEEKRMNLNYDSLTQIEPYPDDIVFELDGMSADEYIAKLTEEINAIQIDSIPFDKWDYIVAFSLALIEVAGDFFIGDPQFKHSLARNNGPLVKWMEQFHDKLAHPGQPLDFQGKIYLDQDGNIIPNGQPGDDFISFGGGLHRAKTFGHDSLPLARLLYGSKENESDSPSGKKGKKIYNGVLLVRDILSMGFAIYSISTGKFIDSGISKGGVYKWVITNVTTGGGTTYEPCNVFIAIIKLFTHMLADFCSSTSLPIPGFSFLTHWPDRDVKAFALTLYKNGMNLRTMLLQGLPIAFTEIMMRIYIYARYKDDKYTESQQTHKLNKLLLVSHGITAAVNVGKVIITKNPARLNILLIARTFHLVWKVLSEEAKLTNKAIEKLELGVVKARVESMQTLISLDKTMYQTEQYERLIQRLRDDLHQMYAKGEADQDKFDEEFEAIFRRIRRKENHE